MTLISFKFIVLRIDLNGHLPMHFCNLFTLNKDIHSHNTRQVSEIHVTPHSTKARANSFIFIGTKLWNLLDSQIINFPTTMSLKDIVKYYCFIIQLFVYKFKLILKFILTQCQLCTLFYLDGAVFFLSYLYYISYYYSLFCPACTIVMQI